MKFVRAHISLEDSPVSVQLNFPRFLLFFVVALKRIVQLSLFILVVNVFAYLTYQHFIGTAQEQRILLFSKFQNINIGLDSLDTKISKSYDNEDLLYAKYGLAVQDADMRELGVGGSILPDSVLVWSASPIKKLKSNLSDRFSKIEAKINRTRDSYLNLQLFIERLHGNLEHTPSILPAEGFLSSPFGLRTHPVTGELEKMHQGIDLSAPKWTTIRVAADGYVDKVAVSETLGKYVSVDHGNGIITRYGHMIMPFAKEGQAVRRFEVIGYMGSTGRTTGNHLHYEVWVNGVAVNPIYYILPDQYSVE
jgi:murein DD-endopeptidase MepM/ murein hydrolase activator NlpD